VNNELIVAIEGRVMALIDEPNSAQGMEIRRLCADLVNWLRGRLKEQQSGALDMVSLEIARAVTSDSTSRGLALLMPVLFMAGVAYAEKMGVDSE